MFWTSATSQAYRRCTAPVLLLAARQAEGPARGEREADIDGLAGVVTLTIRWFETSHGVSAEDPQGVAASVIEFVAGLSDRSRLLAQPSTHPDGRRTRGRP